MLNCREQCLEFVGFVLFRLDSPNGLIGWSDDGCDSVGWIARWAWNWIRGYGGGDMIWCEEASLGCFVCEP